MVVVVVVTFVLTFISSALGIAFVLVIPMSIEPGI